MENYNLYRPSLRHMLIFQKNKMPAASKKEKKAREPHVTISDAIAKLGKVRDQSEYLILEIIKPLSTSEVPQEPQGGVRQVGKAGMLGMDRPSSMEGWIEVEPVKMNYAIREIAEHGKKVTEEIIAKNEGILTPLGSYTLICCAAKRYYWLESKIEISGIIRNDKLARLLKGVSTKRRIETLSEIVTGSPQFHGNCVAVSTPPGTLYGLGNISYRFMDTFSGVFLLDLVAEAEDSDAAQQGSEKYEAKVDHACLHMGKFLFSHSRLQSHLRSEYKDAESQGLSMRQESLNIQERIFNLQKTNEKDSTMLAQKTKKEVDEESQEEVLLKAAAILLSAVNRLEQSVGTNMYSVFNIRKVGEEALESLNPGKVDVPEGETRVIPSLFEEFKRYADSVTVSYQMLRDDANNTQTTLRNSLDVLRTFIEHQQRKIADRQGKILYILTIVFACFGLADAITNVAAYFLMEQTLSALIGSTIAFLVSMLLSFGIFIIVYFAYVKKALA